MIKIALRPDATAHGRVARGTVVPSPNASCRSS
jgi:hypothetical protein